MIKATNELYRQNKGTLEKACLAAFNSNPIVPLDEYRSYADEVFMDATVSFDPTRGAKFNTWLTTQLLRLKKYASRGGAMVTSGVERPENLVIRMDMPIGEDGTSLHDMKTVYGDNYSSEVSFAKTSMDWFDRMSHLKPFVDTLSDDAKTMVDDILDGNAARKDKHGVPFTERGGKLYVQLTPRQLYLRLYSKRGWKFERVRDARIEVEEMLRKWAPCSLPERGPDVQVQDELF